jgi:hypothetical protein
MGQWTVWTFWKKKNILLLLGINHNFSIIEALTDPYATTAPPHALKHQPKLGREGMFTLWAVFRYFYGARDICNLN